MNKLSEHFTLEELTRTSVRKHKQENSNPPIYIKLALQVLCKTILEPIRNANGPVIIHSGYRCHNLNSAIGGATYSQHLKGEAADIHVDGKDLLEVWRWICLSGLPFGQCILEKDSWIHISLGKPYRSTTCGETMIFDGKKYTTVDAKTYRR